MTLGGPAYGGIEALKQTQDAGAEMTANLPEMPNHLTGGCMCGAVRYRISAAPIVAGLCHRNRCQGQQ